MNSSSFHWHFVRGGWDEPYVQEHVNVQFTVHVEVGSDVGDCRQYEMQVLVSGIDMDNIPGISLRGGDVRGP